MILNTEQLEQYIQDNSLMCCTGFRGGDFTNRSRHGWDRAFNRAVLYRKTNQPPIEYTLICSGGGITGHFICRATPTLLSEEDVSEFIVGIAIEEYTRLRNKQLDG